MLQRIAELTADASPKGRRELLLALTDLFLVHADPSGAAQDHYVHIAELSLGCMAHSDRAAYAERVAAAPTLPKPLAKKLASDSNIEVAGSVLKLSPVLTDEELAGIASTYPQSHLGAIAGRAMLSEVVTEVLVQRGDEAVLRIVSRNEGAALSMEGLGRLFDRGRSDPQITGGVQWRAGRLAPDQLKQLLETAAPAMSKEAGPAQTSSAGVQPPRKPKQERRVSARLLIADVEQQRRTADEVITMLAGEDRPFELAQVLTSLTSMPNAVALKCLLDPDASELASGCRSIELSSEAYRAVLGLRATRLNLSSSRIERDLQAYEQLVDD